MLPIEAVKLTYWFPLGATPAETSVNGDIARSGRIGRVGAASGSGSDEGQYVTAAATASAASGTAAASTRIAVRRDTSRNGNRGTGVRFFAFDRRVRGLHVRGGDLYPNE
jgi:hypothetical protein